MAGTLDLYVHNVLSLCHLHMCISGSSFSETALKIGLQSMIKCSPGSHNEQITLGDLLLKTIYYYFNKKSLVFLKKKKNSNKTEILIYQGK